MSASTTTMTSSTSVYTAPAFWERLWRTAGIQSALCFIVGYIAYGNQPQVGASADALTAFYIGSGVRILIAAVFYGLAVLNLMWFSAAVRTTLADAGYDGWGAAATASSATLGGLFFLLVAVVAVVAYSIASSGNHALTSGLNDFVWAGFVLTSFPRAMLIMSSAFGLWRAGQISNALFAAGVAAVVLVLMGGTTWLSGGLWAPDGVYSRFVSPAIGVVWGMVVSAVLLRRSPATRAAW
ncbi:MAG TPA: hypothetical protein VGZ28_12300 [Terriglobales bacterium]|jgi:hypothetical protein|nr:hypothetical protein [Terriglobales bacterium]